MKTLQKGFISPLLLALVAILLIGGGTYVYGQNKQSNQSTPASQTIQPSITITSPVGGETFTVGGPIHVSFSGAQTGGRQYRVDIFSTFMAGDANVYNLGTTTSRVGGIISHILTVPSNVVVDKNYRIRVTQLTDQGSFCDNYLDCAEAESNYFSIVASTVISAKPGGIFAGGNVLIVSDGSGVKWTVNYKNAKYSEAWEGMPDQQFIDWIKNNQKTWISNQARPEGSLQIIGIFDKDGIFNASKIIQFLTDPAGTVPNGAIEE